MSEGKQSSSTSGRRTKQRSRRGFPKRRSSSTRSISLTGRPSRRTPNQRDKHERGNDEVRSRLSAGADYHLANRRDQRDWCRVHNRDTGDSAAAAIGTTTRKRVARGVFVRESGSRDGRRDI